MNPTKSRQRATILIVEDDQLILEMYKDLLKANGFRVITANDGKKAVIRIKQQGADLILLDILMPGLNGFEVLKKLKTSEDTRQTPVIVLTNLGSAKSNNDRQLALSLGAEDYMIKSLNTPDEIVARINTILAK